MPLVLPGSLPCCLFLHHDGLLAYFFFSCLWCCLYINKTSSKILTAHRIHNGTISCIICEESIIGSLITTLLLTSPLDSTVFCVDCVLPILNYCEEKKRIILIAIIEIDCFLYQKIRRCHKKNADP